MRPVRVIWWLACPLTLIVGSCLAGLRLNLTGSLPVGFYVASRGAPVRGALVLACLPPRAAALAKERGYVPHGDECPGSMMPIGKSVLAVGGDTVTVTPSGLLVNGAPVPNSRPLAEDRNGRPLPRLLVGRYVVGPGELWVLSSYSRLSFDSRYFGAIQVCQVRAGLRRLWTAGPDR